MKKLMNLSLSLALALTLCTAVAPTVDFGEEFEKYKGEYSLL